MEFLTVVAPSPSELQLFRNCNTHKPALLRSVTRCLLVMGDHDYMFYHNAVFRRGSLVVVHSLSVSHARLSAVVSEMYRVCVFNSDSVMEVDRSEINRCC